MLSTGGFAGYGRTGSQQAGPDIAGYNSGAGNYGTGGSDYNANKTKRKKDPLYGYDVYDRFGIGMTAGLPLGPAGALLAGTMAAATSFADPGGSVDAPFGSVAGGGTGTGSETSRQIAKAIEEPIVPPVEPIAPAIPTIGEADRKRKRIGRQQTILTSRSALSDSPNLSPTLLGQ